MIEPHWHEQNPWKDRLIYVTIEELAACTIPKPAETAGWAMIDTIARWTQYGTELDAYILVNDVVLQGGVRFGPEPHHYLSPPLSLPKLYELVRRSNGPATDPAPREAGMTPGV